MKTQKILISGAGIAGTTLAYHLARRGFEVTVVERSGAQRSSGAPVDVRGAAIEVATRMGILPRLREAATRVAGMSFIDRRGRLAARVDVESLHRADGRPDIELPRGDLAAILQDASKDSADFIFSDAIASIEQDERGVDVCFERAAPRRFDLVIGADGLHSGVRKLIFGSERGLVRHMGLYVATLPLERDYEIGRDIVMFNAPQRSATIHPSRGRALAAFIFWRDAIEGFDHRDLEQHKRIVREIYATDGWRVPELLDEVEKAPDLFFDSVSRVELATWSKGRVALLGDAASCVSLFGDGSTLAMAGAAVLAESLAESFAESPHDHVTAFRHYEERHRAMVMPRQKNMRLAASLLIPETQLGITTRNLALHLWPVAAAGGWIRRRVSTVSAKSIV